MSSILSSSSILTLQSSWNYYHTSQGFEIGSVLYGKRFSLHGPPPSQLEKLFTALMEGIPAENAVLTLSVHSGLSNNVVQKILDKLIAHKALITRLQNQQLEYT